MPWVHFSQPSYTVTNDSFFWTPVNLSPPTNGSIIPYFWGAQFDVQYDYDLVRCRRLQCTAGSIYDVIGGNLTPADYFDIQFQGTGPNGQGRVRILVDWNTYPPTSGGYGINTSGGTLCNLRWRATTNTGVTDLSFVGTLILVQVIAGLESEIPGVTWTNSTVTVQ